MAPTTVSSEAPGAQQRRTMKAMTYDRYGSTDVLQLRQIDTPSVGDDEVLVQVLAAGVDRGAWHLMTGQPYVMRIAGVGFRAPQAPRARSGSRGGH